MSADQYIPSALSAPKEWASVTPSDGSDLANYAKCLYVGVTGDIAVVDLSGNSITFTAVAGGVVHPIACKRVKATGTTATGIIAGFR